MTALFIITAAPYLAASALAELRRFAGDVTKVRALPNGALLIAVAGDRAAFTGALLHEPPVYVKHLMPVQAQLRLAGTASCDLPALVNAVRDLGGVATGRRFSVQCRCAEHVADYAAKDVEVYVGSCLETSGAIAAFSDTTICAAPEQVVVSIYLHARGGYVGISTVRENLNEHGDEFRVWSREPTVICRAERKLREAMRTFGLDLCGGDALDLGAAPGGWTWVLAQRGMRVLAVDPAELDPRVRGLAAVTHVRERGERIAPEGPFDLIVNDMNADPALSAATMVSLAPRLKDGAPAVMTVKLVNRSPDPLLAKVRSILTPAYAICRMRSLFHNRREVTVLLQRQL